jgi:hypothetical protein
MENHGNSWKIMGFHRDFIGISWDFMEFHGISWNFQGNSWDSMEFTWIKLVKPMSNP